MNVPVNRLLIHDLEMASQTNGPGTRFVIWVQGCSLKCPGCFNPQTHSSESGDWVSISSLVDQVASQKEQIDGITISGGEPFDQAEALLEFCQAVKAKTGLGLIVFTGYTFAELEKRRLINPIKSSIDLLISGRFIQNKLLKQGLRGSNNKQLHFFSGLYREEQINHIQDGEIIIKPSGEVVISGIDPLVWEHNGSASN